MKETDTKVVIKWITRSPMVVVGRICGGPYDGMFVKHKVIDDGGLLAYMEVLTPNNGWDHVVTCTFSLNGASPAERLESQVLYFFNEGF